MHVPLHTYKHICQMCTHTYIHTHANNFMSSNMHVEFCISRNYVCPEILIFFISKNLQFQKFDISQNMEFLN